MTPDFKFYMSLFWRRLPYVLVFLAIGSAAGLTLASVLPPVYRAQAVLIVESQQIPDELAASTVQTGAREQLQIIQQRILTRERLLEMANRLQVYAPLAGEAPRQRSADDIVQDMRGRIEIITTGDDGGRGAADATVVTVSFVAATGPLSAAVTNDLVTQILQENVKIRTNVAGQTLEYFTQEVARLDQELAARGVAVLDFQEANLEALPDSLEFRRSQQAAAQERLVQLGRDEATLNDRRARLVTLYETTGQIDGSGSTADLTPEARQLQETRDRLAAALAILSPQNPQVRVLQAQVAALEATVAAQTSAGTQDAVTGAQLTPYEIQLADLDGQLQFLKDQQDETKATLESLRLSIEATPGNAITLDTLQRDYANIRNQYDQAVVNRARAETGDTLEVLAKGQRITVIEQAIAPAGPESPNRKLVAAAGIGGGLSLGLGLVVLLELLNGAIRRPVDLTRRLGITPFGTVPHFRTRWETVRRRLIISGAIVVVLIGLPWLLWIVNTQVTPLDLLLNRLLGTFGLAAATGPGFPVPVVLV